jgi:hypothetical protein
MLTQTSTAPDIKLSGPARNAPSDGKNVKQNVDQTPRYFLISNQDIINSKNRLKPITPNERRQKSGKMPIMEEFENIFALGCSNFLQQARSRRSTVSIPSDNTDSSRNFSKTKNSSRHSSKETNDFCHLSIKLLKEIDEFYDLSKHTPYQHIND